jgi:hypothetical protein
MRVKATGDFTMHESSINKIIRERLGVRRRRTLASGAKTLLAQS